MSKYKHDFDKYPTIDLFSINTIAWVQIRYEINSLFSNMKEKTRESYAKLCANYYDKIKKQFDNNGT